MGDSATARVFWLSGSAPPFHFPLVADYVRGLIDRNSDDPAFRGLLARLLERPGRVLSPSGSAKWPAFVLETCQALGGDPTAAVGAAAAVELTLAAADVVDDLVDDEWDEQFERGSRAMNATLALTALAHVGIGDLGPALGAERSALIGSLVSKGLIAACGGEDLDLVTETLPTITEELALEITRRKSGSLVAMACQVGAAVATNDARILELVGVFGRQIGVVAQLLNDIAGLKADRVGSGTDLQRRKKTLPIAYALSFAREEKLLGLLAWSESAGPLSAEDEANLAATIDDLGALHYAWVVADVHRREALATLEELSKVATGSETSALRRLIPVVRARKRT